MYKFGGNRGAFINFVEIVKHAKCIIGLRGDGRPCLCVKIVDICKAHPAEILTVIIPFVSYLWGRAYLLAFRPPHEVEWTTPSGVTNVSHALVIPRVIATDAGAYSCRARKMSARNSPLLSEPFNISVQVDGTRSMSLLTIDTYLAQV